MPPSLAAVSKYRGCWYAACVASRGGAVGPFGRPGHAVRRRSADDRRSRRLPGVRWPGLPSVRRRLGNPVRALRWHRQGPGGRDRDSGRVDPPKRPGVGHVAAVGGLCERSRGARSGRSRAAPAGAASPLNGGGQLAILGTEVRPPALVFAVAQRRGSRARDRRRGPSPNPFFYPDRLLRSRRRSGIGWYATVASGPLNLDRLPRRRRGRCRHENQPANESLTPAGPDAVIKRDQPDRFGLHHATASRLPYFNGRERSGK